MTRLLNEALNPSTAQQKWQRVSNVLSSLGPDGQSSEDTDTGDDLDDEPRRLRITVPHYRRQILGAVFEELDSEIRSLSKREAQ